jgi:hypothetical protein
VPRAMDQRLVMAHERANPATCYMVDVAVPDVGRVLRRAADQFLGTPLVSQTPASSLEADPAGALTLSSTATTLATFPNNDDFTTTHIDAAGLTDNHVRGLCWTVDPAFGRAVLRRVTVRLKLDLGVFAHTTQTARVGLQIYRRDNAGPDAIPFLFSTFVPILPNVAWWQPGESSWDATTHISSPDAVFDLTGRNVVLGSGDGLNAQTEYYFVLSIDQGRDTQYFWGRDRTAARTIAGVGTFKDREWTVGDGIRAGAWHENLTLPAAVPVASIEIEHFSPTSTAIYALDLGATPNAESEGRVVFARGTPAGTAATLELSTAGSGGPWTAVTDGALVTTKQQTYHARLILTAPANRNIAPRVSALGVEFRTPVDVTAEATVEPIAQEVDVPFLAASIGEGSVSVVRTGLRDYRDQASDLATTAPVSALEVDVRLGSRNVVAPRDAWMLIDRATVNNRTPMAGAESFGLLSILKNLKPKIPARSETFSTVHTVTASVSSSLGDTSTKLSVTPAIPFAGIAGAYSNQGYFMRVRSSSVAGVESGYVRIINGNDGTLPDKLTFVPALPNDLVAGDVIEVHSAKYVRPALTWIDADLADIWWETLTVHLEQPAERIGRGDMGHGARAGLPPRVEDIEPGDDDAQANRLVTIQLSGDGGESGADLINQISFLLGGATIDVGGQIVYRQIYPLRNAAGAITVAPDPVAATFDVRNTYDLGTTTGLEQRISQLACNFGVDTTAGEKSADAANTTVFADVDAMAWLDAQPVDEMAPATIPDDIARWCYNSSDGGLYLATKATEMVVRACSTGLRIWSWSTTEPNPRLVVGDRVTVITDQYADYDPSRKVPIRGLWAFQLVLISVRGGGRSFRGFMLGLTDALQIHGGPGTMDQPQGTEASEILAVTWEDSPDGTQRTYDVTGGDAVDTVFVHHRLWPVGTAGDPFDFVSNPGDLIIARPDAVDGHFRFTLVHPARDAQRFAVLVARSGGVLLTGSTEVFKITLDPAPPAMSAKMHAAVTNATADVSVDVNAGISDWPVRIRIYEGSPNTTPLVDTTAFGPITIDKVVFPVLGGRPLPLRALLSWWTQLTNVALEETWGGPEAADRDALPNGYIQIEQNRTDAKIRMVFDDDTDTIKVTVPSGKTKTWLKTALIAAGSPVTYTVGDVLDDTSTESALGVDEKRGTYLVEYTGGGVTMTIAPPFILAGPLSSVAMVVNATPGPTSYSIVWSGVGVTVSIDGGGYGTPSPSPIVVTRTSVPHTYDFKQVSGNTNAPVRVDIPALAPTSSPTPIIDSFYSPSNSPISFSQHTTTDIIDLVWSTRNAPVGATFDLDWALDGGAHTVITGVSSPYSHQRTGTGGHGLDLTAGGTRSAMRYTLILKGSGGNELTAASIEVEADHV